MSLIIGLGNNGSGVGSMKQVIVDELPDVGKSGIVYLVPKDDPELEDAYDEYIWIKQTSSWKKIGTTHIDLTNYVSVEQQSFTEAQKSQARLNIGAASNSDIPLLPEEIVLQEDAGETAYGTDYDPYISSVGVVLLNFTNSLKLQARDNIEAYSKPSGGIPKADLSSGVQSSLDNADGAYQKPIGGIPLSDIDPSGIDNVPTTGSSRLVKSGGVAQELALGAIYDVSAHHPTSGVSGGNTYASLSDALAVIPQDKQKGGMTVRYIQSSDNNYVQYRYMPSDAATAATFTNPENWQGVDKYPTHGSINFVESGSVADELNEINGITVVSVVSNGSPFNYTTDYDGSVEQVVKFDTTSIVTTATECIVGFYNEDDESVIIAKRIYLDGTEVAIPKNDDAVKIKFVFQQYSTRGTYRFIFKAEANKYAIKQDIHELQSEMTNAESSISNLSGRIDDTNNEIDVVEKKLGGIPFPKSEVGKYIKTNIAVGETVDLTPQSASDWRYSIANISPGDKVVINGLGGGSPRLWCFVDSNNVVISVSSDGVSADNLVLIAPQNTAKIIINDKTNKDSYFYCKYDNIDKLYGELPWEDGCYYNVSGAIGDTVTLQRTSMANYKSVIVDCVAGDVFMVDAEAGGGSAKCFAVVDSNNKMIARSYNQSFNGVVTIPEDGVKIVISTNNKEKNSYKATGFISLENKADIITLKSKDLNIKSISEFSNNGVYSSFAIDVVNDGGCSPTIVSMIAKYSGAQPTIRFTIGNLFTSTLYNVGGNGTFELKEWRVPPMIKGLPLRISVTVPSGSVLEISDFSASRKRGGNSCECGLRLDSHLGLQSIAPENTMIAYQIAAQCNYPACIVNVINSSDGTLYCYHDNDVVLSYNDSVVSLTAEAFQAKTDAEISQYRVVGNSSQRSYFNEEIPTLEQFFQLCARTSIAPMISVHPDLTDAQWNSIKGLLDKYNLTRVFRVKGSKEMLSAAWRTFGNEIDGYSLVVGGTNVQNYLEQWAICSANSFTGNKYIEYPCDQITSSVAETTIAAGYKVAVWSVGNISEDRYIELMNMGVWSITDDNNCSSGLNW